jgi:hypothetical protein
MTKPVMLPPIATLVIHPAAVARTLVGNSSDLCEAMAGVSMPNPSVARNTAGASIQPLSWV